MLDQTLDTIAPVDSVERESELQTIQSAEADLDKQYQDAQFWNKIANIFDEANMRDYTKDNSIESFVTSSAYNLWTM